MKGLAPLMLASVATAALQEEVTHPVNSFWSADGNSDSKLVGRIGWGTFFERWVSAMIPTPINPDHHPCAFEFQFGTVEDRDPRIGMHLAHNCSKLLIQ